jgi:hypothetical protein
MEVFTRLRDEPEADKVRALARNSDHSTKVIPVLSQWMQSRTLSKTGDQASIVFERKSRCAVGPSECAKVGQHGLVQFTRPGLFCLAGLIEGLQTFYRHPSFPPSRPLLHSF